MSRTIVERTQKMLPTEEVGIANILECENADADKHLKERLPLISCECGAEILVGVRFASYESSHQNARCPTQKKGKNHSEQRNHV